MKTAHLGNTWKKPRFGNAKRKNSIEEAEKEWGQAKIYEI